LREELEQQLAGAATNPKIVATVSTATTAAGASAYLALVPTILGIVASVFGITLTSVLIYYNLKKGRLELKILREKADAIDKERTRQGTPNRRISD
jgi:putative exporter of polyketide antibiotics